MFLILIPLLMGASDTLGPVPAVPPDLLLQARAVDAVAKVYNPAHEPGQTARYPLAFLQQDIDPGRERLERLQKSPEGLYCFILHGILSGARAARLSARETIVPAGQEPTSAQLLANVQVLVEYLEKLQRDKCSGPGGGSASREWEGIHQRMIAFMDGTDTTHRTAAEQVGIALVKANAQRDAWIEQAHLSLIQAAACAPAVCPPVGVRVRPTMDDVALALALVGVGLVPEAAPIVILRLAPAL